MSKSRIILVPTDFSRNSQAALARACELASLMGAQLHLVFVASGGLGDDRRRVSLQKLSGLIDPYQELDLEVKCEVLVGAPHQEIVRYAAENEVEWIVMGTHGRTGLAHFALGSVAERVLRAAPCPVLVVKPDDQVDVTRMIQAADALAAQFGAVLLGGFRSGRVKLIDALAGVLGLSSEDATELLGDLETAGAVAWGESERGGGWRIDSTVISNAAKNVEFEEASSPSPAADLLLRAVKLRATDVHFDPGPDEILVRMRIDGRLEEYCRLDRHVAEHLRQQFKVMAEIDISQPFQPMEGSFAVAGLQDEEILVRVTTCPVAGGEATALRLLSKESLFHPISELGFSTQAYENVQQMLQAEEGAILVTGPTGAGKSTTVYAMLTVLGDGRLNIVSIEDPVEYSLPYVRQVVVNERHGITMSSGLRTVLRMDPDVVFVGEIRDADAAHIAMRAASSGRYVFSTLHTRDVASAVTAVRDLHIDNRSLAANLTGIVNQRLLRRLCPACAHAAEVTQEQRDSFAQHGVEVPDQVFSAEGCDACRGTGVHGRIGVFEAVLITDEVEKGIADGLPEDELRGLIRSSGSLSLTADALVKVRDGLASFDEAVRMRWL